MKNCVPLARDGQRWAREQLVENNLSFVYQVAHSLWERNPDWIQALGIEEEDLCQEGCVDWFEPSRGNKFLSYAAPAIRNAMLDALSAAQNRFEGHYAGVLLWLDSVPQEDWRPLSCFVADPYQQTSEQIYLWKETIREVRAALQKSGSRLRTWLLFRFGFTDDTEHSVAETARHFHLSLSRGKATDKTALQTVRRYYLKECQHGIRHISRGHRCGVNVGFYIPLPDSRNAGRCIAICDAPPGTFCPAHAWMVACPG